jgi:DinB family protein
MADTAEYLERIRQHASDRDPIAMQRETAQVLADLISGVPEDRITARPQSDKWSVGEILAHLAEDELATAWRYRQMVEHDGIELPGFDQDLWARLGDYSSRAPRESLELFRLLRAANVQFLERLEPGQWACCGIHAERGKITIRELAVHMTGHDANHIEQIRRLLA